MAANPVVYSGFMHEPALNPQKALCAKPSYRSDSGFGRAELPLSLPVFLLAEKALPGYSAGRR